MSNYTPPYTITDRMLKQVSSISEKVGKITSHMELGLIRMTIPDKPNSRNQRYVKQ